jgi:hypothetical protein
MGDSACCADEDREEIQEETQKQEDTFDQIGCALGDLKHMSHVSPLPSWCIVQRFLVGFKLVLHPEW